MVILTFLGGVMVAVALIAAALAVFSEVNIFSWFLGEELLKQAGEVLSLVVSIMLGE